jgi:hypothetical protein
VINNLASIVFDTEAPIVTNQTTNTLDAVAPSSSVAPLPADLAATSIPVSWSGVDDPGGSGVAGYDIYVSIDGAPVVDWLPNTTLTSATYVGSPGHTYAFFSLAHDNAGNREAPHATFDAVTTLVNPSVPTPPAGLAIAPDTGSDPGDRITDTGAVVLSGTLNLPNLSVDVFDTTTATDLGAATVTGTAFSTATLNLGEGPHHLRVRASDGLGDTADAFIDVLVDLTPPTSQVAPLPLTETSYAIPVTVNGSDPGMQASGVASYAIFVAVDGAPFSNTPWMIVPASNPTAVYPGEGGHHYYFRSVATDVAGNVENKPVTIESGTYVPDLTAPVTAVDAATPDASSATFTVNVTGADSGGSGLATFALEVQVDNGSVQAAGSAAAGAPDGSGVYTATLTYQASADGQAHTYRFFSKGTDGAGNVEADHASPNDVVVTQTFQTQPLAVTGLVVENGLSERSYIRYLELDFNGTGTPVSDLITQGRITLIQHPLSGQISANDPRIPLSGVLSAVDHAIDFDFGPNGLGGVSRANLSLNAYWSALVGGDGYYEIDVDSNGDGQIEPGERFFFYRLLGDVNGDGTVDLSDSNQITSDLGLAGPLLNSDADGDQTVDTTDKALAIKSRGRSIAAGLRFDG